MRAKCKWVPGQMKVVVDLISARLFAFTGELNGGAQYSDCEKAVVKPKLAKEAVFIQRDVLSAPTYLAAS